MSPLKISRRVHEIVSATVRGSLEFQLAGLQKGLILIPLFYHVLLFEVARSRPEASPFIFLAP